MWLLCLAEYVVVDAEAEVTVIFESAHRLDFLYSYPFRYL